MKNFLNFFIFCVILFSYFCINNYSCAYVFDCSQGCEVSCGGDQACLWRCFTCCPPQEVKREIDCLLCEGKWQAGRCLSRAEQEEMFVEIRVNGSKAPGVVRENIRITVSLGPQAQTSTGDYFLWARIPGGACYCYAYPGQWTPCSCTDPAPAYQGGLVSLKDFFVPPEVSVTQLPLGDYILYFAVDSHPNGLLDEDAARDEVSFRVEP